MPSSRASGPLPEHSQWLGADGKSRQEAGGYSGRDGQGSISHGHDAVTGASAEPNLPGQDGTRTFKRQHDATTGVSAAGARAATAPLVRGALAFYFRAPAKAFISPRLDYMGFARAINPRIKANEAWSLHLTTPGILAHAVKEHGWSFIPRQVLAPLLANVSVGAVLYTSYLQTLDHLHGSSYRDITRLYPPPCVAHTFSAGFVAGSVQSMIAAPLDALQVRFNASQLLEGKYPDMWRYGYHKLDEIGIRGVLSGFGVSFVKDSVGFAAFFATFEYVKAQAFYGFITRFYANLEHSLEDTRLRRGPDAASGRPTIRPHFVVEPTFLLLAGMSATIAQQIIQYPLGLFQDAHYARLESLDMETKLKPSAKQTLQIYRDAYAETIKQCGLLARRAGGWRSWAYRGFFTSTLRQVPSTSAGLIIFELVRRMYADGSEEVRIEKDGYDILLT